MSNDEEQDAAGSESAEDVAEGAGVVAGVAGLTRTVAGLAGDSEEAGAVQEAAGVVGAAATAVGAAMSVARAAEQGDAAGAVSGAAGGLGGAAQRIAPGEAGEVAGVVGAAATAVGAAASVARAAEQGDAAGAVSGAAGGLGGAAQRIVPDQEADAVLRGGQAAVQAGSQVASGLGGGSGHGREDEGAVEFDLVVDGEEGEWVVEHVTISEALNRVSSCVVEARHRGRPEVEELLRAECALQITRHDQRRSFKGIVWHARVHAGRDWTEVELHIVPALQLLTQRSRSRIFQAKKVPEIFEEVYTGALADVRRSVRNELDATYETREYVVQYQESELAFLTRLAEEEGFFWYFDHDGDREELVLVDRAGGLPQARETHEGRADHLEPSGAADIESVWGLHRTERIGATDVVVAGYDWTHPTLDLLEDGQTGRSEAAPALEVYDHTDALALVGFDGEQYKGHTAVNQAKLRAELLDLARQSWAMSSSLVTAAAGYTIEVSGCPEAELDQRYVIASVSGHGSRSEGGHGTWANSLKVVPADMPYRPTRQTPRPSIHGYELATVVGPPDSEIHTDVHGRIRVHFPWDREHERDAEDSSCWMRVMQSWSGPGFGTFYLPRVGMEVVVSFLGGNPDQPLVMGCVYNGDNRAGVELDAKKTQSLIRTKSSPNSEGYNEIRFEDEAGAEFISTHAQKDYNEEVQNDHSTSVHNNQTNTVDGNQTETIHKVQTLTVDKNRTVRVKGSQSFTIDGSEENDGITGSKLEITGDYKVDVSDWIEIQAPTRIKLICEGSHILMEPGKITLHAGEGAEMVLDANALITSNDGTEALLDADARVTASTGAEVILDANADMHSKDGSQVLLDDSALMQSSKNAMVELNANAAMSGTEVSATGQQKAEVSAPTATLTGAAGSVEAAAGGVDVAGPQVNVSGSGAVNVAGSIVKIN